MLAITTSADLPGSQVLSKIVKLAREIAARSQPRFIEIEPERRTTLRRTNDWLFVGGSARARRRQSALHRRPSLQPCAVG